MSSSAQSSSGASKPKPDKRKRREQARTVVAIVLAILITLFAVLNTEEVKVNWIFGTTKTPLIIVIAVSAIVGAVLALFVQRQRRSSKRP
jgi:uncharacterized integral membrane protein